MFFKITLSSCIFRGLLSIFGWCLGFYFLCKLRHQLSLFLFLFMFLMRHCFVRLANQNLFKKSFIALFSSIDDCPFQNPSGFFFRSTSCIQLFFQIHVPFSWFNHLCLLLSTRPLFKMFFRSFLVWLLLFFRSTPLLV